MQNNVVIQFPVKEVAPSNEFVGLLNWSLPWARGFSIGLLALGLQSFGFALFALWTGNAEPRDFLHSISGIGSLFLGLTVYRYYQSAEKYVLSELEKDLAEPLYHLSLFMFCLPLFALARFLYASSFSFVLPHAQWIYGGASLLYAALWIVFLQKEKNAGYRNTAFLKHVNVYAALNIGKTRTVGFFVTALGSVFLWASVTGTAFHPAPVRVAAFVEGIAFALLGSTAIYFWRGVREIHRNPSPIYLERTLASLGFFWLTAPVSALLYFGSTLLFYF